MVLVGMIPCWFHEIVVFGDSIRGLFYFWTFKIWKHHHVIFINWKQDRRENQRKRDSEEKESWSGGCMRRLKVWWGEEGPREPTHMSQTFHLILGNCWVVLPWTRRKSSSTIYKFLFMITFLFCYRNLISIKMQCKPDFNCSTTANWEINWIVFTFGRSLLSPLSIHISINCSISSR